VYLGTVHTPLDASDNADMGLNQRGGMPGFVRAYTDGASSFVVIPDYSGHDVTHAFLLREHYWYAVITRV
jgi:hypothetical protein